MIISVENTGEIDKYFYCSADGFDNGHCRNYRHFLDQDENKCIKDHCWMCHRKWPTPEQFKEEYGHDVPDDFPIWERFKPVMNEPASDWRLIIFEFRKGSETTMDYVCTCTPWGKPPDDWRPVK